MAAPNTQPNLVSTFQLGGCTWEVHISDDIADLGHCDLLSYKIMLKAGMSPQATSVTFYHELVHAILFSMGKTNHDEEFVENFGGLLFQYMQTMQDIVDGNRKKEDK